MSDIGYSEKDFENYIVTLLSSKSGYIHGSNNDYNPQKSILPQTFISFVKSTQPDNWTCLCDKFDTEQEAEDLLSRAGFAFSPVDTIDTIYQFCIENAIYDFRIIDELVYEQTELINPYTTETSY